MIWSVTQFKPSLAKFIYDNFPSESVLDISSGWGDRMVGAIASEKVQSYLGFDPNFELKPGHDKIRDLAGDKKDNYQVIYSPFETAEFKGQFDLCFSSTPFYNFEEYNNNNPDQSYLKYPKFEHWMTGFLYRSMINAWNHIKMDGHLILHISDLRDYKICEAMVLMAVAKLLNCQFDGVITCVAKDSDKHRLVWVFRKTTNADKKAADSAEFFLKRFYPDIYNRFI